MNTAWHSGAANEAMRNCAQARVQSEVREDPGRGGNTWRSIERMDESVDCGGERRSHGTEGNGREKRGKVSSLGFGKGKKVIWTRAAKWLVCRWWAPLKMIPKVKRHRKELKKVGARAAGGEKRVFGCAIGGWRTKRTNRRLVESVTRS